MSPFFENGSIPVLRKNCKPLALFPFINTLLSNNQIKIFIYSIYPFLLQTPFLPTQLINHIFSWKVRKHTGIDITCFLRCKIFTNITFFWESPYGTSQTSKLELFTKNINGFWPNNFCKKIHLRCLRGS